MQVRVASATDHTGEDTTYCGPVATVVNHAFFPFAGHRLIYGFPHRLSISKARFTGDIYRLSSSKAVGNTTSNQPN